MLVPYFPQPAALRTVKHPCPGLGQATPLQQQGTRRASKPSNSRTGPRTLCSSSSTTTATPCTLLPRSARPCRLQEGYNPRQSVLCLASTQ